MKSIVALFALIGLAFPASAGTTITATNKLAYAANVGWMDWRGDTNNGAVIGDYVCAGCIYAANVGWLNLGSGSPADGIRYQNSGAGDFGVNHDGLGNLRGYAWGANIGWIAFEVTGAPKADLATGKLSGYAWSASCGWISLSNAVAQVQTGSFWPGTMDANGLPVAWELACFGETGVDPNADPDQDGVSNYGEYLAGTDPNDGSDCLRITSYTRSGSYNMLWWTSKPTRLYRVERRAAFDGSPSWETIISDDLPGWDNVGFDNFGPQYFYRIRAVRPPAPQ